MSDEVLAPEAVAPPLDLSEVGPAEPPADLPDQPPPFPYAESLPAEPLPEEAGASPVVRSEMEEMIQNLTVSPRA